MVVLANSGCLGARGQFCFYCGRPVRKAKIGNGAKVPDDALTQDHVTPRSRGGKGNNARKVVCCFKCNQDKFSLTLDEYRAVVAFRAGEITLPPYKFAAETLPV